MASSGIYSQLIQPLRSVADYRGDLDRNEMAGLQIEGQRGQNALQQAAREQGMARQNALQSVFAGGGDQAQIERAMLSNPLLYKEGMALQKGRADNAKAKSEATAKDTETENKVIGVYRDVIGSAADPMTAATYVQAMHSDPRLANTAIARVPIDQALAQIGNDPQTFARWKQEFALGAEKFVTQNKPTQTVMNNGGMNQVIQTPGLGGTPQTVMSAPITESANNVANNVRQAADNAANRDRMAADADAGRSVQMRGQDLTNARARDLNGTQRELLIQERGFKIDELKDKAEARDRSKQGTVAGIEDSLRVLDKALDHPGRKTATGLSGTLDPRNYTPGTDATDFKVVLDQIGGKAFLQAFESLKGGGQITEVEGKKATDAIARLNRAQSDGEFEVALNDLRGVMDKGYERYTGKSYARPNQKGASGKVTEPKKAKFLGFE